VKLASKVYTDTNYGSDKQGYADSDSGSEDSSHLGLPEKPKKVRGKSVQTPVVVVDGKKSESSERKNLYCRGFDNSIKGDINSERLVKNGKDSREILKKIGIHGKEWNQFPEGNPASCPFIYYKELFHKKGDYCKKCNTKSQAEKTSKKSLPKNSYS
jgi:hypothetical protein